MTVSDVIIVGGGPAGASTAYGLARLGARVVVLDRARFPRPKPCAEYLSPQASRILAGMGVLEEIEQTGPAHLAGMVVHAPNGARILGSFSGAHGFRGFRDCGLSLRREVLDSILLNRARAAGATVDEGARVVDVARDATGRAIGVFTLAPNGKRIEHRSRLVVGADGLRSVVSRRLGLAHQWPWPRRIALATHFRGVHGVTEYGEMHVARDGYVGLADVGDGVTNVAAVFPQRSAKLMVADRARFLADWLARQQRLVPRFVEARRVSPVRAVGPFASHARRGWAPGAILVGDAADFFDPFTGEGIYSALRGGELAAYYGRAALDARDPADSDAALAEYDRVRRLEFRGKWIVERTIGAVIASAPLINRAARVLEAREDLADLLVGVAGDFIPARLVIRASFLLTLFARPVPRQ